MFESTNLQLSSSRLDLRPLRPGDARTIARIMRNPRVAFWRRRPYPLWLMQRIITHSRKLNRRGLGCWLVYERTSGELAGIALLQPLPGTHEIEVGYHFLPEKQGRGYATEAANRLLEHGFEALKLPRIRAIILPRNHPSLRVAEKLGFSQRGTHLHAGLIHRYLELSREAFIGRL